MKIILTGSTGFVGSEVLNQCLRNPAIDSIIALSRRKLPDTISNSKLKVFLMDDFAMYPQSVVEEIRDADACIW
jgi:nucleoside-diphosphate-sugar epimerase